MDITPQVINEVEFRQKVRGYDPDEVDDFLERMAIAVGELQSRLREAVDRAIAAESGAGDRHDSGQREVVDGEASTTISRAILAAQRTADALVQEARDNAERLLNESKQQAQKLMAEAESKVTSAVTDAERLAREAHDTTRDRMVAELKALESSRDELQSDVAALESHLDEQRSRLGSAIAELQRVLDDPESLRVPAMPELSGAHAPEVRQDEPVAADPEPEPEPEPQAEIDDAPPLADAADDRVLTYTVGAGATGRWDLDDQPEDAREAVPADDRASAPVAAAPAASAARNDGGPPTESYRIDLEDHGDAYLDELRKAMAESDEFGPGGGLFDQDEATELRDMPRSRSRFGRKR